MRQLHGTSQIILAKRKIRLRRIRNEESGRLYPKLLIRKLKLSKMLGMLEATNTKTSQKSKSF